MRINLKTSPPTSSIQWSSLSLSLKRCPPNCRTCILQKLFSHEICFIICSYLLDTFSFCYFVDDILMWPALAVLSSLFISFMRMLLFLVLSTFNLSNVIIPFFKISKPYKKKIQTLIIRKVFGVILLTCARHMLAGEGYIE